MIPELGIRLEAVNGLPIWEAQPLYERQKAVEQIAQSICLGNELANACMPWRYTCSSPTV